MIIAVDYDDTWTRDPDGWYLALHALKQRGHKIVGATMRHPREATGMDSNYDKICEKIYFTGRKAKRSFLAAHGVFVDVWIDDNPIWVETDAR